MSNVEKDKNRDLIKDRDIILDGSVSEKSVRIISEKIIKINRQNEEAIKKDKTHVTKPINLIINTFGGSLYDANMLIGVIQNSKVPIHTYCYGKAMSAGLYIYASGDRRYASPLATFMYHDGAVAIHDTIHGLKHDLEHQTRLRDNYDEYILSVTKLPKSVMDEKKKFKEDWYMFAKEAHQFGLVDEILEPKRSK